MDVVDKHQMPPRRARFRIGRQREGAGDDALALLAPLAAQRCCRLDAEQQVMIARRTGQPREFVGEQRGLIEPARPQPPTMERHRNEQDRINVAQRGELARHQPRHQPRVPGPPPIFQPQRHRAGDRAVGERRRRALKGRRLGKARPASDLPARHCLG